MKFLHGHSAQLNKDEILSKASELKKYIAELSSVVTDGSYVNDESSIYLSYDAELREEVERIAKELDLSAVEYIIDIGIGGSNLGTKATYDALLGYFDVVTPQRFPKIIFLDTNDPAFIKKVQEFVKKMSAKPERLLINVITKSGSTTETIVNLEAISEALPFELLQQRMVITTMENSKLWNQAHDHGIKTLAIPAKVGGRYSVLSAVGLLPLYAAGIDIDALRSGAQDILQECLVSTLEKNPAALSAAILYLHYVHGKAIHDTFLFHPELESLGKWYRQLLAESLGKEKNLAGETVHLGFTPTVSVGSVDLHSVAQLYLGGPFDKITTFVSAQHRHDDATLSTSLVFPDVLDEIEGKSASEIMWAIFEGVKIAYQKHERPFVEFQLNEISEYEIGQFLQCKMVEVMFLAKLFEVNAFDQPNVESYKLETKQILSNQ